MFTISKLKYKNMLGVSLQLQFTSNLTLPLTITSCKQMFFLHFCPPLTFFLVPLQPKNNITE